MVNETNNYHVLGSSKSLYMHLIRDKDSNIKSLGNANFSINYGKLTNHLENMLDVDLQPQCQSHLLHKRFICKLCNQKDN